MSTQERRLAGKVTDALASLSHRLQDDNPKAEALAECLNGGSDWTLICYSAQAVLETRAYWESNDARTRFPTYRQASETIACAAASSATITSPAIVVGWLGKRRMPELLHPPVSPSLTLLLYDFESAWYYGLQHMCEEARRKRGGHGTRHKLLGSEGVWHRDYAAETSPDRIGQTEGPATDSDDFDDVMTEYQRARAIAYARTGDTDEPDVDTTIHWFGNGLCAFLTSKYKAKVVTHLIEESVPSEGTTKSEVRLAECSNLSVGDYLLFHRGSDADAIRVTADEILKSPSFRSTARLWQRALHRFRDQEGLTPRRVWERLKANGCDHHLITIKHWLTDNEMIAPRDAHTHELEIIATVTGDAELRTRMSECKAAITKVWGAHLAASHHLATNVIIKVAHSLAGGSAITDAGLIEIAPSVLLSRIVGIEPDTVSVKRSMTNQIIEESNG